MKVKQVRTIKNVIARDKWEYFDSKGNKIISEIIVGKPVKSKDRSGDWYCPVFIENFTKSTATVWGVGPVDSLMNAMTLVHKFFEKVYGKGSKLNKKF
jgi:hypothetical protein